jgi:hypothetical protein
MGLMVSTAAPASAPASGDVGTNDFVVTPKGAFGLEPPLGFSIFEKIEMKFEYFRIVDSSDSVVYTTTLSLDDRDQEMFGVPTFEHVSARFPLQSPAAVQVTLAPWQKCWLVDKEQSFACGKATDVVLEPPPSPLPQTAVHVVLDP